MDFKYKEVGDYLVAYTYCSLYESQRIMVNMLEKVLKDNPDLELHTMNTTVSSSGRCYLTLIFKCK